MTRYLIPSLIFLARALLLLLGFLGVSIALVYLMLPSTPFQNRHLTALVEKAAGELLEGASVTFDNLTFQKGYWGAPFRLKFDEMRVYALDETGQELQAAVLEAYKGEIALSVRGALNGRALQSAQIDQMKVIARRGLDGAHRFSFNDAPPATTHEAEQEINPLAFLQYASRISVRDAALMLDSDGHGELETVAHLTLDMRRNPDFGQSYATVTLREDAKQGRPSMDLVMTTADHSNEGEIIVYLHELGFERVVPWFPFLSKHITTVTGTASGEARLVFSKRTHRATYFLVEMNVPEGQVQLVDTAPKPIDFKNISINILRTKSVISGLFQGRYVEAALEESADKNKPYKLSVSLPELSAEDIAPYWPESNKGVAREWVTQKLEKGTFRNIKVTGDIEASQSQRGWSFVNPRIAFDTQSLTVHYKKDLAPAENLKASGVFEKGNLVLDLQSGSVKGMDVLEGKLTFLDLIEAGKGDCKGFLRLRGGLGQLLAYLDNPIMRYKERTSVDLSKASGNVQMTVALDFPTTKDARIEDVKVNVDAVLSNASLPDVVSGVTLSGGALAVKSDPTQITIFGEARLNTAAASLRWQSFFDTEEAPFVQKLELKSAVTRETIDEFGAGDWARDVNTPSKATLSYLQPVHGASKINLNVTGTDLSIASSDIKLSKSGSFASATLNGLVVGKTQGDMRIARNKGNGYHIDFSGANLDLRPVLVKDKTKKSDGTKPANLSVAIKAGQILTSDSTALQNAAIQAATNGKGDLSRLDLDATAAGTPVKIRFNEGKNGDTLRVDAQNAGAFLSSMGLTKDVQGGVLEIEGQPNGGYGLIKGRARIINFTARDVPALGRLINALSLPGLFQLFTSEGIAFERLRSDFTWTPHDGGQLRLQEGATRGASLGLTFSGLYAQKTGRVDLSGQIVPLSEISGIVREIPVLGTLLTGGKNGGLVAATYTMKGPIEDPNTMINPLSVLAPGILRNIFFESNNPASEEK